MIINDIAARVAAFPLLDQNAQRIELFRIYEDNEALSILNQSAKKSAEITLSLRNVQQDYAKKAKGRVLINLLMLSFIFACTVFTCIIYPSRAVFAIPMGIVATSVFSWLVYRDCNVQH